MELFYNFFFFLCQLVWIMRIHGWEVAVLHRIFQTVDGDDTSFMVDAVEQQTVVHFEFRTSANGLGFELELDDGDSLVHLGQQSEGFRIADGLAWNWS